MVREVNAMKKRVVIASIVFVVISLVSFFPVAIAISIADLYLSGHGIFEMHRVVVLPGMDAANLLFITLVFGSGIVGAVIYWWLSKAK
jgi:hypothetical protein